VHCVVADLAFQHSLCPTAAFTRLHPSPSYQRTMSGSLFLLFVSAKSHWQRVFLYDFCPWCVLASHFSAHDSMKNDFPLPPPPPPFIPLNGLAVVKRQNQPPFLFRLILPHCIHLNRAFGRLSLPQRTKQKLFPPFPFGSFVGISAVLFNILFFRCGLSVIGYPTWPPFQQHLLLFPSLPYVFVFSIF